jgi:Tol biopolymer transport system component
VGHARRLGETEATDASFFPDGRLLYTLGTGLYIAASDGSNSRKLLDLAPYVSAKPRVLPGDKRLVAFPKVSPDATKIVFNTLDANNQLGTIFEMASDGTNVDQLLKGELQNLPREICCAKWTPNGQYLVSHPHQPLLTVFIDILDYAFRVLALVEAQDGEVIVAQPHRTSGSELLL